jgi:hypothetical protein
MYVSADGPCGRPDMHNVILTNIIVIHVPMAFIDWAAIIVWLIEHKWNLKWSIADIIAAGVRCDINILAQRRDGVMLDCGESPYESETMV